MNKETTPAPTPLPSGQLISNSDILPEAPALCNLALTNMMNFVSKVEAMPLGVMQQMALRPMMRKLTQHLKDIEASFVNYVRAAAGASGDAPVSVRSDSEEGKKVATEYAALRNGVFEMPTFNRIQIMLTKDEMTAIPKFTGWEFDFLEKHLLEIVIVE
jgi:hypothetical protein